MNCRKNSYKFNPKYDFFGLIFRLCLFCWLAKSNLSHFFSSSLSISIPFIPSLVFVSYFVVVRSSAVLHSIIGDLQLQAANASIKSETQCVF